MEVEAGAYFKKGDVLISTLGNPFIYNGIINREGDMGCIYGISAYGEITSEEVPIWTSVCGEDKSKYVRLATEEEKKSFAERIANTENLKKAGIIKQYLSEYEYLLTKEKKCDFKPFDQVLVRASNLGNWNLHLFARVREEEYNNEERWNSTVVEFTRENVLKQLEEDVRFGFEKALNQRGISASLMFECVMMWNYILEEGLEDWDEDDYGFYGLPLFKATAVKYGWDNPIGEDSGRERKYDSQY